VADEVNAGFVLAGSAETNRAAWRAEAPAFLAVRKYRLVDESYESLVYEANVTTKYVKIVMFGFAKTLYRLSFTFRDVDGATRVTALGQAMEPTREALARYAAEAAGT
jgi:hypothetical protein